MYGLKYQIAKRPSLPRRPLVLQARRQGNIAERPFLSRQTLV